MKAQRGSRTSSTGASKEQVLRTYQRAVFSTLFLGYACYTYNRKSVSYALPTLLTSGLITTATNPAHNPKPSTIAGLALSGGSTLLFSRTEDPRLWALLWFSNGFAQGAGWPACAKLLKKWFSPANFGTWWSVLTASSNVSGTLSPLIAAYVIMHHGWSASLILAGLVSIMMAGVCLVALVDDPAHVHLPDPTVSARTSPPTKPKQEKGVSSGGNTMTVRDLAYSPFLWVVSVSYMVVFCSKTALSDWGQIFLIEELGRSQMQASSFTSAIETGGFIGGILAGVITDKMARRLRINGNVRLMVAASFMVACATGLHLLCYHLTSQSSQLTISAVGVLLGASMFGPISIYGIVASESFPAHLSGTAHAVVALAANVGAVVAGWPLSWVARTFSWNGVFLLLEILAAFSVLLIVLSRRIHIVPKAKTQ
ncbi:glucose-6-phosphate exchanger SLC37A4-like [Penaeus japonicus]|uniref:glucose-6-phosphate exchanger SLC37A4-like n=1 Tax=Penaeus japonicus TaxID=27405 RepID=UPI001C70E1DC|nr:glucose-6-phosphate exchanger SLC37A4-like [Penaeus japonicus]